MKRNRFRKFPRITIVLVAALSGTLEKSSEASVITWFVNPEKSSVRWTIPDQLIPGLGTIQVRNQAGTNSPWTIGNENSIDGNFVTEFEPMTSLTILSSNMFGVFSASSRPNFGYFNPLNTNAANPYGQFELSSSGQPGTIASVNSGKFRGAVGALAVDVGYFTVDTERYSMSSPQVLITGNSVPVSGLTLNATGPVSYDGIVAPIIGQPLPDFSRLSMTVFSGNNQSPTGTIVEVEAGHHWHLVIPLTLDVPILTDAGFPFVGRVNGTITADAYSVPEVSTSVLCGLSAIGFAFVGFNRLNRSGRTSAT